MIDNIRQLMAKEGNVKGEVLRADLEYVKSRMGDEGLKKVEEKMAEMGYPLRLEEVKRFEEYKEAQAVLIYIVCREIFGWDEEEIAKMGEFAAKRSFIVKTLLKYFVSLQRILEEIPNFWVKHHDFGELEVISADENKKFLIVRVKGYDFHPLACAYHRGYFFSIAKFSIKGKNITIDETDCVHRRGKHHQYKVTWE